MDNNHVMDEDIDHISLYGQQPMLWMRHIDHIFIIWTTTDDNNRYWMRHIDHIFIIWTTTDVMDETH